MKLLITTGQGIGNIIMASPLIKAGAEFSKQPVDVYLKPTPKEIFLKDFFYDPQYVNKIKQWPDAYFNPSEEGYDFVLNTSQFFPLELYDNLFGRSVKPEPWPAGRHEIEYNLDLLRKIGYPGFPPSPFCVPSNRDFNLPAKTVAISPGCKKSWRKTKVYPHYKIVAQKLISERINVVVAGSKEDKELIDGTWPKECQLFFDLDIRDASSLLKQCDLVISNDSGLAHVSCALNIKTLVIFGATDPKKTQPWGSEIIQKEPKMGCQPCVHILGPEGLDCRANVKCLDIPPEVIFDKIMKVLNTPLQT